MLTSSISRRLALTVFLVVALHAAPYGVQNHRYSASVASLVDDGHWAISERFGWNDPDFIQIGDLRYPNMPPGMTLLLAPGYWIYSHVFGTGGVATPGPLYGIWVVVTQTAPMLALVAVLMFRLLRRLTDDESTAVWLTLGLVFGTPVFAYGTAIWSHDYSLALVVGIFYLSVTRGSPWVIGALMGMLALMENHAPLAIGMLGGFELWTEWTRRRRVTAVMADGIRMMAAFAPFVVGLAVYNHAITGSVFQNAASVWFAQQIPGQPVFTWPTLERVWGMTFSLFRGGFVYAPLTLLAAIGLVRGRSWTNPTMRFAWIFALGYFGLSVTFIQWGSGVAFGPRYFTSALPFMLMTAAVWPGRMVRAWALVSILINWAGATTNPTDNVLLNLAMFAYRGPFPKWLDYVQRDVLPRHGVSLDVITPFWLYVALGAVLWRIWRLRISPATWSGDGTMPPAVP